MVQSAAKPEDYFKDVESVARATPTFPRFFGFNSSCGLLNKSELKRQYRSHQNAVERIGHIDTLAQAVFAGIFSLGFSFSGFIWALTARNTASSTGVTNIWYLLVIVGIITLMGFGIGLLPGVVMAARVRYKAVYGETIIVDRSRLRTEGKVIVGHTYLKRLGFISRSTQRYFFGATQQANVNDGMIVLDVGETEARSITEMTVGELYDLKPGRGDLTGSAPADCYAYIQMVEIAGEMERKLKVKKAGEILQEGGIVLIAVVAIIAIFLQAQSGFQLDVTTIDVGSLTQAVQ